jgi:hypothetical protein
VSRAGGAAVPFLLMGESRRRLLKSRVQGLLERWYRTWAPERASPVHLEYTAERRNENAMRADELRYAASTPESHLLQIHLSNQFLRILSGLGPADGVFTSGPAVAGALSGDLTASIVRALCIDLVQAAQPATMPQVERIEAVSPVKGQARDLEFAVTVGTEPRRPLLHVLLSPPLIDLLIRERPAVGQRESLVARRKASGELPVRVSAVLGTANVAWRDLTALSVGDVIVLDQSLAAPCSLQIEGGQTVADAHLGRIEQALAAQLTRVNN